MGRIIIIVFTLLCLGNNILSQCSYDTDLIIVDKDTTTISLLISGAVNNDLATNNCLQSVSFHFKHEILGDMTAELISPSGQVVRLVGPTVNISGFTSFITWKVQFVANSILAVPDPGYSAIWDNLQTWLSFTTYVGTYYPNQGQLEDFNIGPVNGLWKLNIIDHVLFEDGEFLYFDMSFCDSEGLECNSCTLVEHSIDQEEFEFCEGDASLDLSLTSSFDDDPDFENYEYEYAVFKDSIFSEVVNDLDFTTYPYGDYIVCGLYYFDIDSTKVDLLDDTVKVAQFGAHLIDNKICGNISNSCLTLTINSVPEVVTMDMIICEGDVFEVNGVQYDASGLYTITTPTLPCDSISMLNLTVLKVDVDLADNAVVLTCDDRFATLDAAAVSIPLGSNIMWTTPDGGITTPSNIEAITIDRPGTYFFTVDINGCQFSDSIKVVADQSFILVEVDASDLSCGKDSIIIDIQAMDFDSVFWSGPAPYTKIDEDIRVGTKGIYTFQLVGNNDCVVTENVEIKDIRVFPEITYVTDTITCKEPIALLYIVQIDTLNSTYEWYNQGGELISTDTFAMTAIPGLHSLEVTSSKGCISTYEIMVEEVVTVFDIGLVSDTINCNSEVVDISYTSSIEGLDVFWTLPDLSQLVDSTFVSSLPGTYFLHIEDDASCELDTFLTVSISTETPTVSILPRTFFCGDDSLRMQASVNIPGLDYNWTSNVGFVSNEESPYIYVPGSYFIEVCAGNGCCAYDTMFVGVDVAIPNVDFVFENIDCDSDTVYIIPSDTITYDLIWTLNGDTLVNPPGIIEVTAAGLYVVSIVDKSSGCKSSRAFNIREDFNTELLSLSSDIINCVSTEVEITFVAQNTFLSYVWTGPGLLDNTPSPMVNMPGIYIIDYIFNNGCSGSDTIEVMIEGELPGLSAENSFISCDKMTADLHVDFTASNVALTWEGPGFTGTGSDVTVTAPGTYYAYAVAPGNCKDTLTIIVEDDTSGPEISLVADGIISCTDGEVEITALLSDNTAQFAFIGDGIVNVVDNVATVNAASTYVLAAVGTNGCIAEKSITIESSIDFPMYTKMIDTLTCSKQDVNVGIISNDATISIDWQAPIPIAADTKDFVTSTEGKYIFTITNNVDCSVTDSFFVVYDTISPNGIINLSNHITCDKQQATLSIQPFNPSWQIDWAGPEVPNPNVSSLVVETVGDYSVKITGRNGCVTVEDIVIEYDTISPVISIGGEPISCTASKTFLKVISDLDIIKYAWQGPNNFVSDEGEPLVFDQGIYTVVVTAENGCTSSESILVEDERVYPSINVDDYYLPCDGAPVIATYTQLSEDATSRWLGPNNFFAEGMSAEIYIAGEYYGVAINEEGCSFIDTFLVIDEPILPIFGGIGEALLCFGPVEMTAIDVDDDRDFIWQGPQGYTSDANPALTDIPGIYQLIVTSNNGCNDTLDVEVEDGRIYPEVTIVLDGIFQCTNLEVGLSADGQSGNQYRYSWQTLDGNIVSGAQSKDITVNDEGLYIVTVLNTSIGCQYTDSIELKKSPQSFVGIVADGVPPTCFEYDNAKIEIIAYQGGYAPYEVMVDGFSYGTRLEVEYLAAGSHQLTVIDSLGCQVDTTIVILEDDLPMIALPDDVTICHGDSVTILLETNYMESDTLIWSLPVMCNECLEVTITPQQNTTINVILISDSDCKVEDEMKITVDRLTANRIPFPQIFSPNGDGINDFFYLPMTKGIREIQYVRIYDTWGGLLYERGIHVPGIEEYSWDGKIDGSNVGMGVYVVEAMVVLIDGTLVPYVGDVTVVR